MIELFTKNWWTFTLRGLLAIAFGILALVWPGATIAVLAIFLGIYLLLGGIFAVVAGLATSGKNSRWWTLVLEGLAGIILGLVALFFPGLTEEIIVFMVAIWAVVVGFLEISSAFQIRHEIANEVIMIISGLLAVIMGILLFVFPIGGVVSIVWIIGVFSIAFGIALILLSLRMRRTWRSIKIGDNSSSDDI